MSAGSFVDVAITKFSSEIIDYLRLFEKWQIFVAAFCYNHYNDYNSYKDYMFLVIEGIDGAGCETQAKNLLIKLQAAKKSACLIKYPDYQHNVGRLIKEFLYKSKKLSAEQQFLLHSLQFLMDKQLIAEKRKRQIIIADRYFTTALCYQTLEGVALIKALNFASDFKIEKPDLVFYLDVNPKTAVQRKYGEIKEKNRREKDFDFIKKTYQQYAYLVKNQVWTKWVRINGNQSIDEVTSDIYNKVIDKSNRIPLSVIPMKIGIQNVGEPDSGSSPE